MNSDYSQEYSELEQKNHSNFEAKKDLIFNYVNAQDSDKNSLRNQIISSENKDKELREEARAIISQANPAAETNDKDYVFIHFILNHLPKGVIGLLLAMALCAAMSSTSSELNALATTTTMDLYKRNKDGKPDGHYLKMSKWFTFMWGVLAILFACVANLFDNLIQLVNIIGSIFYGNVLGIFLLAFFFKFIRANSVFIAAIITQIIVIIGWKFDWMPYLWLNLFGCALVIFIAIIIQSFTKSKNLEDDLIENIGNKK